MSTVRKARGAHVRVCSGAGGETMARGSFAQECDINRVMAKFTRTGVLPVKAGEPFYGDFSAADDYQSALNKVMHAEESFASLPANIRKRFENNPAQFLAFVGDSSNRDEAIELGLINPPQVVGQKDEEPSKMGDSGSEQSST